MKFATKKRKARRKTARRPRRKAGVRKNPPLRQVGRKGTGWIDARRVKIVRKGKKTTVLVEKR
jgi:hypothetical protein